MAMDQIQTDNTPVEVSSYEQSQFNAYQKELGRLAREIFEVTQNTLAPIDVNTLKSDMVAQFARKISGAMSAVELLLGELKQELQAVQPPLALVPQLDNQDNHKDKPLTIKELPAEVTDETAEMNSAVVKEVQERPLQSASDEWLLQYFQSRRGQLISAGEIKKLGFRSDLKEGRHWYNVLNNAAIRIGVKRVGSGGGARYVYVGEDPGVTETPDIDQEPPLLAGETIVETHGGVEERQSIEEAVEREALELTEWGLKLVMVDDKPYFTTPEGKPIFRFEQDNNIHKILALVLSTKGTKLASDIVNKGQSLGITITEQAVLEAMQAIKRYYDTDESDAASQKIIVRSNRISGQANPEWLIGFKGAKPLDASQLLLLVGFDPGLVNSFLAKGIK